MDSDSEITKPPPGSLDQVVTARRAHDKRWVVLMIIAIGMGVGMEWPFNLLQVVACGLMLAHKVGRLLKAP